METGQANGCTGINRVKPLGIDWEELLPISSSDDDHLPLSSKIKSRNKLSNSFPSSSRRWPPPLPSPEELHIHGSFGICKRKRNTKVQRPSCDRISTLPSNTIEKILTLMPIKDALRTSILSRKWRYFWTGMPVLVFDNKVFKVSSRSKHVKKYKFINAISHVLLLHKGPILEFSISIGDRELVNDIDLIILHLSKKNIIKKFIFKICLQFIHYKMPSWFFSFHGLEHIDLTNCRIELPSTYCWFSMLKSLIFCKVDINAKILERFLTGCPVLEEFTLIGKDCSSLIESSPSHLAAGGMPQKLRTPLTHMRILVFNVCFLQLSSVICMLRSSPNLEKINMKMCCEHWLHAPETSQNFQDCSDLKLDHLNELEITRFRNSGPVKAFVKLIMAKSPVLKKAGMELHPDVSVNEELEMLRDLLQIPFPHASPAANFIIERPKVHR